MKDYRPISCCNVMYKVISKIISNRLRCLLPDFISPNQTAFVKGRLLMENVLLASELVKDYHKDSISPRCAMKIDISKDFDSVKWDCVLNVLEALCFPETFIHWIRLCITTALFSVQVNGELAGYFQSERGLRQGCSLSPYLFVISMTILSKLLDKAAIDGRIGYHPKCQPLWLTHLCFADDVLIFVDGNKESVKGVLKVLNDFAKGSGLKISIEKSTLFMAGMTNATRVDILKEFPFAQGTLPVRYLGLPLLTKQMTKADYSPLLEKIRNRFSLWTARQLSYAGRLQLLRSVIASLANFWISSYRLPSGCIDEIDKLCSAFLWSGPELSTTKAKVTWSEVCLPKKEGGLGLHSLREANKTSCLKLIWRLLSKSDSLWVKWITAMILKHKSFWELSEDSSLGSWMWKKLMKYKELAKQFHRVNVKNGRSTSFWFDKWCGIGRLFDLTGRRGFIDMGISSQATVEIAKDSHRRRRHRNSTYEHIEEAISELMLTEEEDVHLWRRRNDTYKAAFSTKETRLQIHQSRPMVFWYRAVWFAKATPKYSFFTWLAVQNRLSTGDRIRLWNPDHNAICRLCSQPNESRNHLFFSCHYSTEVWKTIAGTLLGNNFSTAWDSLLHLLNSSAYDRVHIFTIRYAFQATIYHLWRERNGRRHGDIALSATRLAKLIDKNIRNRFSSIRQEGNHKYDDGLTLWLATRLP